MSSEMENSYHYQISLGGTIGFDREGQEVLVNTEGKAFAIDETIKELWKEIETAVNYPGKTICNLEELWEQLPYQSSKKKSIYKILEKLHQSQLLKVTPQ